MDTLKGAISLCATIYQMYGTFTSNKGQCDWLLSNVKNIATVLKMQLAREAFPDALNEPLVVLQEDLRACKTVLEEFGMCGKLKRFVFGSKHAKQFAEAGDRLHTSYFTFCHAVNIHIVLDVRDEAARSGGQTNFKIDMIVHALQQAVQRDAQEYEQDLSSAMQDPEFSVKLADFGISSNASTRHQPFLPSAGARAIATFEDAQSCSWFMRSEELTFDTKEVGKGKAVSKTEVRLGKPGSFGDVFSAVHCEGTPVAVKKLKYPNNADDLASYDAARASFALFVDEVSFAFSLNHPNIVRTLGGVVDAAFEPPCWIVMERLGKSLAEIPLEHAQGLALDVACKLDIIIDICSALVYLHSSKCQEESPKSQHGAVQSDESSEKSDAYSHRDLKPENIMYQDGVAKLIDFGIAKMSKHSTRGTSVQGTYNWMSPEQALTHSRKTYTLCDMFSFGLIVKWLMVGERNDVPFKDLPTDRIILEHKRLYSSGGSSVHPYVEDLSLVPPEFRSLIQFCTATDASKRWTAPQAMWELNQLKARFAAAGKAGTLHFQDSCPPDDAQRRSSPPPPTRAATAAPIPFPPMEHDRLSDPPPPRIPPTGSLLAANTHGAAGGGQNHVMQGLHRGSLPPKPLPPVPAAALALTPQSPGALPPGQNPRSLSPPPVAASHSPAASGHEPLLLLGSQVRVRIHGLKANPELNGCTGLVCGDCDAATGRWTIRLDLDNSLKQLLPANIKVVSGVASSEENLAAASRAWCEAKAVHKRTSDALVKCEKIVLQGDPRWKADSSSDACQDCSTKFSLTTWRHHCRVCGLLFCDSCSQHRKRGCEACLVLLQTGSCACSLPSHRDFAVCNSCNQRGCRSSDAEKLQSQLQTNSATIALLEQEIRSAGGATDAKSLLVAGCSIQQLESANIDASLASLKSIGCDARTLKNAGVGISLLKSAGFNAAALLLAGYDVAALLAASLSVADLKSAGVTAAVLKSAGCSLEKLQAAGYDASALKLAGFSLDELKRSGFSALQLHNAGFDSIALKASGFSAHDLKAFEPNALFEASVSDEAAARHAYLDCLEAALPLCDAGYKIAGAASDYDEAALILSIQKSARAILAGIVKPMSKADIRAGLDKMPEVWKLEQTALENQIQPAKESAARRTAQLLEQEKAAFDGHDFALARQMKEAKEASTRDGERAVTELQALLQAAKTASQRLKQQAQAILGFKPNISGQDSKSLLPVIKPPKAAAYDAAAFRAGGCDCAIKVAGFTFAEAKAAGCDVASCESAGWDLSSLILEFGFDAVFAAGCDMSSMNLCFVYNGHAYKSLADHDPRSTQAIDESNKLYNLDPAWHICPRTPDALRVCASCPWAAYALVLADGSAHWTALAPTAKSTFRPGKEAASSGCLRTEKGQYGIYDACRSSASADAFYACRCYPGPAYQAEVHGSTVYRVCHACRQGCSFRLAGHGVTGRHDDVYCPCFYASCHGPGPCRRRSCPCSDVLLRRILN